MFNIFDHFGLFPPLAAFLFYFSWLTNSLILSWRAGIVTGMRFFSQFANSFSSASLQASVAFSGAWPFGLVSAWFVSGAGWTGVGWTTVGWGATGTGWIVGWAGWALGLVAGWTTVTPLGLLGVGLRRAYSWASIFIVEEVKAKAAKTTVAKNFIQTNIYTYLKFMINFNIFYLTDDLWGYSRNYLQNALFLSDFIYFFMIFSISLHLKYPSFHIKFFIYHPSIPIIHHNIKSIFLLKI